MLPVSVGTAANDAEVGLGVNTGGDCVRSSEKLPIDWPVAGSTTVVFAVAAEATQEIVRAAICAKAELFCNCEGNWLASVWLENEGRLLSVGEAPER